MALARDIQNPGAAQVGLLMRAYRESFVLQEGRKGVTQEELLQRMAEVDTDYGERFSHTTVSRWETGITRPTVRRLQVFGKALDLSGTEVAGLVLLAGLAPDLPTALKQVESGVHGRTVSNGEARSREPQLGAHERGGADAAEFTRSSLREVAHFTVLRILPLAVCIAVGGYALSLLSWEGAWISALYVSLVVGLVMAQGFLLPDQNVSLREFFWVTLFFVLSSPLLQFAPIRMDHYGLYTIGDSAGTHAPTILALLLNLALASTAGLMYQLLWRWQYSEHGQKKTALQRAAWSVVPPVAFVYAIVLVISNVSVWIQLAFLMPLVSAVFTSLLVLRDPSVNPSGRERQFLLWTLVSLGILGSTLGMATVLAIYVSPNLPMVLPDHNLLRSWELDFVQLGFSRQEALDRVNLGYMWHAISTFTYIFFVVGGHLVAAVYRVGNGNTEDRRQHESPPGASL
ncbi:MAG: helix-turn-helix transcriptional regulator [Chloroflexi bacterium]|nr:helix-turn-helix transcriptional regulator [Chloroflexota bacterium]